MYVAAPVSLLRPTPGTGAAATVVGMDPLALGSLALLALVDSTSIGTLLVPIWLLLAPGGVTVRRMGLYLGTVAGFYLVVGTAVALGLDAVAAPVGQAMRTPAGALVQVGLGAGLIALSFVVDPGEKARRRRAQEGRDPGQRVMRWRDRTVGADGRARTLVLLALAAAALEVATMLPYLAAISLVSTSDLAPAARLGVLVAYCLVMVLPAALLTVARVAAARHVDPLLTRLGDWMTRTASSTTGWVLGIAGFLVARDAVARLGGGQEALDRLGF
jgi:hypothetical protein